MNARNKKKKGFTSFGNPILPAARHMFFFIIIIIWMANSCFPTMSSKSYQFKEKNPSKYVSLFLLL